MLLQKDKPEVQKQRISEIVAEVFPGCEAVFDDKHFRTFVRFRIDHKASGAVVVGPVTEHASVLADYSDAYLRQFIEDLAPSSEELRYSPRLVSTRSLRAS